MAREIVDEINAAETRAAKIIADAREKAKNIIDDEKKMLSQKKQTLIMQGNERLQEAIKKAQKEAEEKKHEAAELARIEAERIKVRMLKHYNEAARLAVERILEGA